MSEKIYLYTTSGCHLCEQVEVMFAYLQKQIPVIGEQYQLEKIEIANDDNLVADYGVRIPVLKIDNEELGWPFEIEELANWLVEFNNEKLK